ncbi:hypothetical protein ACFL3H_02335 [Gemmatimonadota bacterium]
MKLADDLAESAICNRFGLLVILLTLVAIGCGGTRDDRDNIRNSRGEPDDIQFIEGPISDWEIWTYFDTPIVGKNYEYRFERSNNTCGGSGNWIITFEREITPFLDDELIRAGSIQDQTGTSNPIRP